MFITMRTEVMVIGFEPFDDFGKPGVSIEISCEEK